VEAEVTPLALFAAVCLALAGEGHAAAWTRDRTIDGQWAVLEAPGAAFFADPPADALPAGTREGDRFTLNFCRKA
jgi:hypothetical protein